ncbi:DUF599 domain-containing protein [Zavarzinia compransoris]|uniref:DUF599 domain-containing protein n=1 Tax=Zavarzinia compransoris TaxID=1264899 RepID=A0A317E0J3_9PROT|nr:DUF599 domain-containing protein [Zavarzinia compransoris]PWR19646.1 DUF599 domain-containing protein [Zavarzinia compransoris]TDP43412.1 putative membrane protein [Zavarzinia compransoris]
MEQPDLWRWAGLGAGALALALFDLRQRRRATARQRHARLRGRWLDAVLARPGQEIVAVQTIRNSVMAATIVASTTVIALMGTISLVGPVALHLALRAADTLGETAITPVRTAIGGLIVATLFTSFILATQSARFYNHLGYLVGFGADIAPEDRAVAQRYVALAGRYYSDSLRTLFYLAPLVAGLLEPLAVLPGVLLIIAALAWFDRGGASPQSLSDFG